MAASDQGCPDCPDWAASVTFWTITFTPSGGAGVCWEVVARKKESNPRARQASQMWRLNFTMLIFSLVCATQAGNFHLQVSKGTLRVYLYKGHHRGQENVLSSHPSGLGLEEAPPLTSTSSLAI